jgi:hypothetical protein
VLAGAQVQLKQDEAAKGSPVSTGANGAYAIGSVANGSYTIAVSKDGYNPGTITNVVVSGAALSGKNLTLTKVTGPTYKVSGTVTGSDDSPLQGAKVLLKTSPGGDIVGTEKTTGPDGKYETIGVSPGNYTVEVTLAGYFIYEDNFAVTDGNIAIDPVLEPIAVAVSGTITTKPSTNPTAAGYWSLKKKATAKFPVWKSPGEPSPATAPPPAKVRASTSSPVTFSFPATRTLAIRSSTRRGGTPRLSLKPLYPAG